MKKLLLLFITAGLLFSVSAQNSTDKEPLVIFLVRHAEKVDGSHDSELSEAGKQRAIELAETLKSAEIEFVHSTDYIRTRNTAAPTANLFNLKVNIYSQHDLADFAQEVKNKSGRHLVVGHSNTTPKLVKFLGGEPGTPIVEKNEYDRLYILNIDNNGKVSTFLMRYGKKFDSAILSN